MNHDYCAENPPITDYCANPTLTDYGPDAHESHYPLQLCEGDCDYNSNCEAGLVCFGRNGYSPIPGCNGVGVQGYDYCAIPDITDFGPSAHISHSPLEICEGDCDYDSHCEAGLICFQRDESDGHSPIPGCNGYGYFDYDYCVLQPSAV